MTGLVSLPSGRFAVFTTRPTSDFVRRWHDHIDRTGEPEAFECISTDRPSSSEGMYLLSDDVKVPVQKRADGGLVPCPICCPTSPKFAIGRMAWFPLDKAVRFIGHNCAARHFEEHFKQAEVRFRTELQAIKTQELWEDIAPSVHWLIASTVKMVPVAKALQECRSHFGWGPQHFPAFFYRVQAGNTTVPISTDRFAQTGELKGLAFLAPDFRPYDALKDIRAALDDARRPLPSWTQAEADGGVLEEIVERGQRLQSALKALPRLLGSMREAREFLTESNFQTFAKWFASGKSPFGTLHMTLADGSAELRATIIDRQYALAFEIPKTAFGILPSKADVNFRRTTR